SQNKEVTETVEKIAAAYGVKAVEGMMSHQQKQNVVDGEKAIMLNPNEQQRRDYKECTFQAGEVYAIDMILSTGEGKARPSELRTTIYRKTDSSYQLKMKASRAVFAEISQNAGAFPFTLRALGDENKARLGITECAAHGVVDAYPIFTEKAGDVVAQFQYTVFVTANGPVRITTSPFDEAAVKSEKQVEDETVKELLAQSVAAKKKKKNKKRSGKSAAAAADKA
ncbi:proliferation-associated protein 2G4-like protein, partial [Thamnocephalis sphaerospora]